MFVQTNTIPALLPYYQDKLSHLYPKSEIDSLFYFMCYFHFGLEKFEVRHSNQRLSESELLVQRQFIKRLEKGEPIQHVIGVTEFYGLQLKVTGDTLVPRPETEELVDWILQNHQDGPLNFIDIGTGTGCIPISLKANRPRWSGHAYDLSAEALEIAQKNASAHNTELVFHQGDILTDNLSADLQFDLIVSNPPYVLEQDKAEMAPNVLEYDPQMALFVPDTDPLKFYSRIVTLSQKHLKPEGHLYFEIHEKYGKAIVDLMQNNGFKSVELRQDLQGKDRMIYGQKSI